MSPSSDAALAHLQRIRPNDGWGVERKNGGQLVRLTRRNVPVTDGYFLDLHVVVTPRTSSSSSSQQPTMIVVGILTGIQRSDGTVQAQKLVDGDTGKLFGNNTVQLIAVSNYPIDNKTNHRTTGPAAATGAAAAGTRSTNRTTASTTTATSFSTSGGELSFEQNQDIVKYGLFAVLIAVAIRVITSSISAILFLVLPLLFLFLLSTCPSVESFDVKKELKRILRGHHLPESHPEKPKGFLEQTLARIQATVVTELATLPGYTVQMECFANAILLAIVVVPSVDMTYYWLGAANRWYYIYGSPNNRPAATAPFHNTSRS